MIYKIGQKVKIKRDLTYTTYKFSVSRALAEYDYVLTIKEVVTISAKTRYIMEETDATQWDGTFIEGVQEKEELINLNDNIDSRYDILDL